MQKVWTPPMRLVFGAATALGLFSALQAYRLSTLTLRDGMNVEAWRLLILNLTLWYVPAAVTPLIFRLSDRYKLEAGRWARAFDVHALDYLLKPFDKDRFRKALSRARDQLERRSSGDLEKHLLELMHGRKPPPHPLDRFVVKASGRIFFVRPAEIEWIEAAGNYVKLHVGTDAHLFRETMNAVEARLDADVFFRIHRSHIVNIERVRELQPWFNGEYVVCMKSGARLTLSRGYREKLQERIGRTL